MRQSDEYAKYLRALDWKVDGLPGSFIFSKKVPLLGSIAKIQRPEKIVTSTVIQKIIKLRRVFYISIETKNNAQYKHYLDMGFSNAQPFLVSKTLLIDLTKPTKTLLAQMHQKTRYNIGLAKRRGVTTHFSRDVYTFTKLYYASAKARGMFIPQTKEIMALFWAFGERAQIILAIRKDKIIAGILIICNNECVYYMYAFSNKEGKKHSAPSLLIWRAIEYGKKLNMESFDFEGIYDKRFPNSWKGFTRFKKGFGGVELEYPKPLKRISFLHRFNLS